MQVSERHIRVAPHPDYSTSFFLAPLLSLHNTGWYTNLTDNTFHTDGLSRVIPDPVRYPSSMNGAGFKPLVEWTHSLGLKFGIHVMRGTPDSTFCMLVRRRCLAQASARSR